MQCKSDHESNKKLKVKSKKEVQLYEATATNAAKKINKMTAREFKVSIDQNQAQQFARTIYSDIAAYISMHQADYEKFLQIERSREQL